MAYKSRRDDPSKESVAHQDVSKNLSYYNSMLKKVRFHESIKLEMQKDKDVPLCTLFVFGRPPEEAPKDLHDGYSPFPPMRQGCYHLNFHQDNRHFKIDMCHILNNFGHTGWLTRLDKPKANDPDDKWALFGGV